MIFFGTDILFYKHLVSLSIEPNFIMRVNRIFSFVKQLLKQSNGMLSHSQANEQDYVFLKKTEHICMANQWIGVSDPMEDFFFFLIIVLGFYPHVCVCVWSNR